MNCPICGCGRTALIATKRALFHRCLSCSFVLLDPSLRPTREASLSRYALHRNSADDGGYVSYLSSIIDRSLELAGPGVARVLDWGSGPNAVCSALLSSRGFLVDPWDPNFCSDRLPDAGAYDLALCVEVAEHFFDPIADFSLLASRLRSGGHLAVHTHFVPDSDDDFIKWWYKEDTTHVSFYSVDALSLVAGAVGLAPLCFETDRFAFFRRA